MDLLMKFPTLPPEVQEKILNGPAMQPPEGYVVNLIDPPNRNDIAYTVSTVCLVIVCAAFAMRVNCQISHFKRWRIQDYFGVLAFLCFLGMVVGFFLHCHLGGFLQQQWNIRFRDFQKIVQNAMGFTYTYMLTMLFSKTAILLEWISIFVPQHTRSTFFWLASAILLINVLSYSTIFILELLVCRPLHKLWQPWVDAPKCLDKKAIDEWSAILNLISDIFILLLPQGVIWRLNLSKDRKIGVSAVFSLGILAIGLAALRIPLLHHMKYVGNGDSKSGVSKSADTNTGLSKVDISSLAEATCAILIFCTPAIPKGFSESWIGRTTIRLFRSLVSITALRRSVNGVANHSSATNAPRIRKTHGQDSDTSSEVRLEELEYEDHWPLHHGGKGIVRRIDIEAYHEPALSVHKNAANQGHFPS